MALGRVACQRGYKVRFFTAAGLINALVEARNEKNLLRLQAQLAKMQVLIVDELGYVPFSKTGAELLFEIFSQRRFRRPEALNAGASSSRATCCLRNGRRCWNPNA